MSKQYIIVQQGMQTTETDKAIMERTQTAIDAANKELKDNGLYDLAEIDLSRLRHATITIMDADWKHNHICTDNIMKRFGFVCMDEQVIGDSDDDSYSSTHDYLFCR